MLSETRSTPIEHRPARKMVHGKRRTTVAPRYDPSNARNFLSSVNGTIFTKRQNQTSDLQIQPQWPDRQHPDHEEGCMRIIMPNPEGLDDPRGMYTVDPTPGLYLGG